MIGRQPPLDLIRKLTQIPPQDQFTTAITFGELPYGASKIGSPSLAARIMGLIQGALVVLPFDDEAAEVYGPVRARLEADGRRLAEPDLRIASIALSRDLTVVTGNVRHFTRVPGVRVENWLR